MSYDILLTDFNLRINDKMMDGINTVYTVTTRANFVFDQSEHLFTFWR